MRRRIEPQRHNEHDGSTSVLLIRLSLRLCAFARDFKKKNCLTQRREGVNRIERYCIPLASLAVQFRSFKRRCSSSSAAGRFGGMAAWSGSATLSLRKTLPAVSMPNVGVKTATAACWAIAVG